MEEQQKVRISVGVKCCRNLLFHFSTKCIWTNLEFYLLTFGFTTWIFFLSTKVFFFFFFNSMMYKIFKTFREFSNKFDVFYLYRVLAFSFHISAVGAYWMKLVVLIFYLCRRVIVTLLLLFLLFLFRFPGWKGTLSFFFIIIWKLILKAKVLKWTNFSLFWKVLWNNFIY